MVRINLVKDSRPHKNKQRGGDTPKKEGKGFPTASVFSILFLLAAAGGVYYCITYLDIQEYLSWFDFGKPAKEVDIPSSLPPAVPKDDATPLEKPSSKVRVNMAENVIDELDNDGNRVTGKHTDGKDSDGKDGKKMKNGKAEIDNRVASKLDSPYEEMGAAEKINYEVLFGRNAFEMVTRCTPPGIRFRSLDMDDFQTVSAGGAGVSKEMVQEMFAAFKSERGELLPKPHSYIKDDEKGSGANNFTFVITHKPRFGIGATDSFQAIDHIGFKEGIPLLVKKFSEIAGKNGYKMSAAPGQIAVERAGVYRRVVYKASGMSTYVEFHKFVNALYSEKVPCAFKKVIFTPVKDELVLVTAEILFTVKE